MSKNNYLTILFTVLSSYSAIAQTTDFAHKITTKSFNPAILSWYNAPAKKWDEALPVGNGRLGANRTFWVKTMSLFKK
jgi:alpha-L-fucosidase 2